MRGTRKSHDYKGYGGSNDTLQGLVQEITCDYLVYKLN